VELTRVRPVGAMADGGGELARALGVLRQRAPRGTLFVVLSDLLEFGDEAPTSLAALGTGGRQVILVQVLDPLEALFPLEGPVRLRASEGSFEVETNATLARAGYLDALAALQSRFRSALRAHGGDLVICRTDENPVSVVRAVLRAAEGRTP
jgi:uncharacterized protein (DUF58 family)